MLIKRVSAIQLNWKVKLTSMSGVKPALHFLITTLVMLIVGILNEYKSTPYTLQEEAGALIETSQF